MGGFLKQDATNRPEIWMGVTAMLLVVAAMSARTTHDLVQNEQNSRQVSPIVIIN